MEEHSFNHRLREYFVQNYSENTFYNMKYVPNTQLPMMDGGLPEEQPVQEKKLEYGGP